MTDKRGPTQAELITVTQHVLEAVKIGISQTIMGEHLRHSLGLEFVHDMLPDHYIAQLTGFVLADKLPPEHFSQSVTNVVYIPATWWQHFKHQYQDKWWMRTIPWKEIRYRTETFTGTFEFDLERWYVFPKAKAMPPSNIFGTAVRWAQLGEPVVYKNTEFDEP